MSTKLLAQYCAPTLAGLKVSNLFTYQFTSLDLLNRSLEALNQLLNKKGIYFTILKIMKNKALIFVYRKNVLIELLSNSEIQEFLLGFGYEDFNLEACFFILKKHLLNSDFPHEIGVFLGYPLNDIEAFIKYKGTDFKCVGCWKVYTNELEAKKVFTTFNKCTKIYLECARNGFNLKRLTVAS